MTLIGRNDQVQFLVALLGERPVRLVTLTGPAGVGKTSLAHEVIRRLEPDVPTQSISFASLAEASRLAVRLANALGIAPIAAESWESRVIDHLRDKRMVLLLDNLEHLLPIPFLSRLGSACPEIQILATSRTVLRLSDEHIVRVPPLAVPSEDTDPDPETLRQFDSVRLLIGRARRVVPDFDITPENASDILTLVRQLDGLPLALELAAARMNTFGPGALSARLDDRMSLLVGGPMDKPEHQRTLRSTIAWSYHLLPATEQRLFRRLSMLNGRVSPEMALEVCGEPEDTIEQLINLAECSLIQLDSHESTAITMLESMRIFAARELDMSGESDLIRDRLARYCLQEITRLSPDLIGTQQSATVERIERLRLHITASLRWLESQDRAADFTTLACSLFRYWRIRGLLVEAEYCLGIAIKPAWASLLGDEQRAMALAIAGWVALERGQPDLAESLAEEAIALADAETGQLILAQAWRVLALVDNRQDNSTRATERMELSLEAYRRAGDTDGVAGALNNLAILALDDGDWQRVIDLCEESTRTFTALGNIHGASHSLDTMGIAQYELQRYGEAMRSTLASLKIDRSVGDARGLAVTLDHVGKIARAQGDLPAAWEAHAESLVYRKQVGDPRGLLVWLQAMAYWLVQAGRAELAARILGALEITRTSSNLPLQHHEMADHRAVVNASLRTLGEDNYSAAIARGRWASLDDLTEEVRQVAEERTREIVAGTATIPDGVGRQYGLTDREEEVFHLLARRLSDREIADELSISARTVNRHVSNVLAKLDLKNRREVTTLEARGKIG